MRTRLLQWWRDLSANLWFLPSLMAAGAVGLAILTILLDERISDDRLRGYWWIYSGGADGARAVLSTIASSLITVAGVAFSITVAALSLTSTQFGPRLLRNFTRDPGNQASMGAFIATFLYCLLVLRTVRGGNEGTFVPPIAVSVGVVLALLSLGALLYFIGHACASMQASHVVMAAYRDLEQAVDRLYPQRLGHGEAESPTPGEPGLPQEFDQQARPVAATCSGYIQGVDSAALMQIATEADLIVRLTHRPGHFIVEGDTLAFAWPRECATDRAIERLCQTHIIGTRRSTTQDVEYCALQVADVALRSLSPGINDPRTAMTCMDWLGAGLRRLAGREAPSRFRRDGAGRLRVVAEGAGFTDVVDAVFDLLRESSADSAPVALRLLDMLAGIAGVACRREDREALLRQAGLIYTASRTALPDGHDLGMIEARHAAVVRALTPTHDSRPASGSHPDGTASGLRTTAP